MTTTSAAAQHRRHHEAGEPMSHRQILEALSGLLLGMFVAILSSTVVSNALPIIVPDLHGTESGYTWVVTASLLATTVSTPIWGKLADLYSKKLLVQLALVIFVVASAIAGLSVNMTMLISMRVVQGIGAGGLTALAQVIMAAMISPRERGRYSGYLGATFALATVGGPLIGGALTEHLSWHWCFYVGVPFAVAALVVLQKTLHLPVLESAKVRIDYLGALLLSGGVSALLIWVSLAGQHFAWWSWQTAALVGGGVVLLALTVVAEARAAEPIIPLRFFRIPTVVLSALASLFVGIAMFGATIFLSQYFQLARGETPTMAGVLTLPMIVGLFLSSTIAGQFITRTGRWKGWILGGAVLLSAGLGLMSTVEWKSDYWLVAAYMFCIGVGVGAMMQNLVLAVQNVVAPQDLGSASSFIAFTRTLGGAIGVSALGAVLAHRVTTHLTEGLRTAGINPAKALGGSSSTGVPNLSSIPQPVRTIVQAAYGSSIADIFLAAAPFAVIALIISLFFKEVALRGRTTTVPSGVPSVGDAATAPIVDATAGAVVGPSIEPAAATGAPAHSTDSSAPAPVAAPAASANGTLNGSRSLAAGGGLGVSGAVRRVDGRPLAGAAVTVADQSGRQVARGATGSDGRYRLAVPSGGSFLLIVAAAHVAPTAMVLVVGAQPVVRDVVLSGGSAITGRVLATGPAAARASEGSSVGTSASAADGQGDVGVQGALVTLTDVTGEVVASARADGAGAYAFEDLIGGAYVLTAQAGDRRPVARAVEVPDFGAVVVDLHPAGGGRLTGSVLAASDGRRLREATVTLVDGAGAVVGSVLTGADGSYAFEDLPGGRYTVTAAGYAPVASGIDVQEDAVSTVHLRLGTTTTASDRSANHAGHHAPMDELQSDNR